MKVFSLQPKEHVLYQKRGEGPLQRPPGGSAGPRPPKARRNAG